MKVGEVLGAKEQAYQLVASLKTHIEEITKVSKSIPSFPTVAFLEWLDPVMGAGNWMPELVNIAGGKNLFGIAGEYSGQLSWQTVLDKDPDVIVVSPCGFDISRTLQDVPFLMAREGWQSLKSVRNGRVYLTDGNQFFNRPGPRLVESAQILAEIFHPRLFKFGHKDYGWVTFANGSVKNDVRA